MQEELRDYAKAEAGNKSLVLIELFGEQVFTLLLNVLNITLFD